MSSTLSIARRAKISAREVKKATSFEMSDIEKLLLIYMAIEFARAVNLEPDILEK